MRIALVGTRGVPARYGGFETCVEQVGLRLVRAGHEVVVYCRTPHDQPRSAEYEGMQLVHLPSMRKKSLETLSHTALSTSHLRRHKVDAAIVFNAANAVFLPLLRARGIPVATHVDGLEWKRTKWQGAGRHYYRMAEALAVRWSDALIADAQGIADYYYAEFHAPTELIAYGAPILSDRSDRLAEIGLASRGYHLVVARFEPENHVDVIVDGYRRSEAILPLVVIGRHRTPTSTPRAFTRSPTSASCSWAGCGTRICSTNCTGTAQRTCTATRSAAPTRLCCGRSVPVRRRLPIT